MGFVPYSNKNYTGKLKKTLKARERLPTTNTADNLLM
jgi:hypothetical protein